MHNYSNLHNVTFLSRSRSVILIRLIVHWLGAGLGRKIVHQTSRGWSRTSSVTSTTCPLTSFTGRLHARPKHGASDRHHAHVGHTGRVVGWLNLASALASQQFLEAIVCWEAGNLFQSGYCQSARNCRFYTWNGSEF